MKKVLAEYIWIDGTEPTPGLRSKTKIIELSDFEILATPAEKMMGTEVVPPIWTFDGSSTNQADGSKSDVILKPVRVFPDPFRGLESYLVMCETFNADGSPNSSNHRQKLRQILGQHQDLEPWVGFEQEYFLMKNGKPVGWPETGFPAPQFPYYCGVGGDKVAGRELVEAHLRACLQAGIGITGINAEVALGQWEFQCFAKDLLEASDMLWVARWLLYRIAERFGLSVELHPKPISGDWNGSGMHTNFSTKPMREGLGNYSGLDIIKSKCHVIGLPYNISKHLAVYGADNHLRLTGKHETCSINEFRFGVSDRGASIRIPLQVAEDGYGYFEDRRPAANADPYQVAAVILETITEVSSGGLAPEDPMLSQTGIMMPVEFETSQFPEVLVVTEGDKTIEQLRAEGEWDEHPPQYAMGVILSPPKYPPGTVLVQHGETAEDLMLNSLAGYTSLLRRTNVPSEIIVSESGTIEARLLERIESHFPETSEEILEALRILVQEIKVEGPQIEEWADLTWVPEQGLLLTVKELPSACYLNQSPRNVVCCIPDEKPCDCLSEKEDKKKDSSAISEELLKAEDLVEPDPLLEGFLKVVDKVVAFIDNLKKD